MYPDLSDRQKEYLRVILDFFEEEGSVKIRDISNYLGVSPASVVQMMRKLNEKKLVTYRKYDGVSLTPAGRNIAETICLRYKIFRKFLEILQVPTDIAIKDAYILGQHLDPMTVNQFSRFVDFAVNTEQGSGSTPRWEKMFKRYCNDMKSNRTALSNY
jgi:DtxR family Mn-dependent transcriptional regulator